MDPPNDRRPGDETLDTASMAAAQAPAPRPRLHRGLFVGRYVVIDCVGEGGMGIVYKAYDPELERAVALKLLHAGGGHGSTSSLRRERLQREAKALARLSHPNVLAVFDVGTFDGDVFLATEFVEGTTLGTWQRQEKRARADVLRAYLAAGDGLAAAHRAGLVHRDFKPSNVIVGQDGRVRVLDFGLARAEPADPSVASGIRSTARASARPPASERAPRPAEPSQPVTLAERPATSTRSPRGTEARTAPVDPAPAPDSSASPGLLDVTITAFGQILGTPRYMAPEQHLGRTADARSDQFGFCVSLYEALYGEFPFAGRGDEYAENVKNGRLLPPPAKSDVPRGLRAILVRGLALAPGDRFPSMDALLAELRRDPAAARRRWLAIGGASIAIAVAVVGWRARPAAEPSCRGAERKLAGVWDDARKRAVHEAFAATRSPMAEDAYRRTEAALDEYASRWVGMHTEACEATRVRGEQSADLLDLRVQCLGEHLEELRAQVDVLAHADGASVAKAVQAARALPRLDACADAQALRAPIRPPSDPQARGRVDALRAEIARAKALQRAGKYSEAMTLATASSEEATRLAYRPVEAEALFVLGDLEDDTGDYATAEHTLRRSAAAAVAGGHEAQAARALIAIVAEVGLQQARFADAHEWALLAQAEVERSNDPFIEGELPRNVGRLLFREGKYDESRAEIQRCLDVWERSLGKDDDAVAGPLTDLGNVALSQGKYGEAATDYGRSLAILEKTFGPDSPSLAPNLNNLGNVYESTGDYARAAQSLERARALWEGAFGAAHPKVAFALYNLSRVHRLQGDVAGALAMAERALVIWQKAQSPEHPDVAMGMQAVAEALRANGAYEAAVLEGQRALAIREKIFGPRHADVADSLVSIGETRLAQGRPSLAAPPLDRALAILEADPDDPMTLGDVRFDLARAIRTTDPARSHGLATRAREAYASASGPLAQGRVAVVDAWLAR